VAELDEVAVDLKLVPYYGDPHKGKRSSSSRAGPDRGLT
jgi:hypothetical protein